MFRVGLGLVRTWPGRGGSLRGGDLSAASYRAACVRYDTNRQRVCTPTSQSLFGRRCLDHDTAPLGLSVSDDLICHGPPLTRSLPPSRPLRHPPPPLANHLHPATTLSPNWYTSVALLLPDELVTASLLAILVPSLAPGGRLEVRGTSADSVRSELVLAGLAAVQAGDQGVSSPFPGATPSDAAAHTER